MFIFKKRDVALELIDEEIYSYDLVEGKIDKTTEGRLLGIIDEDVQEIERLLKIDSIEDYGIEILDDKPVEIDMYNTRALCSFIV